MQNFDDFTEKYTLLQNHLDKNAACDGQMFETFGDELEFVVGQPSNTLWTLVDCDGHLIVMQGFHLVNRLGYFITEQFTAPEDIGSEFDYDDYERPDPNDCSECGRSFGPHYTGECEHD